MELAEIYIEFDRQMETCISEIQWQRGVLSVQILVQTFFHACGHSNIASNGHSTLRKLLMAIMDYHFVSSNSFWEWLATLHTIHHSSWQLLYTTHSCSSSKHQSQTGGGKHKDRHCMGIKTYRDSSHPYLVWFPCNCTENNGLKPNGVVTTICVLNRGVLWNIVHVVSLHAYIM